MVYKKLSQDSTILENLKLICANYLFFVNTTNALEEGQDIITITQNYEELKRYINTNDFYLLNNIALLDEKQMKQLIVDKYNMERITITTDDLLLENLDNTINDIKNIIFNDNINYSGLDIDDINLYVEYKKIIS